MSIWNTPVNELPWYHKVWAKPLNWFLNLIIKGLNKIVDLLRK